MQLIKSQFEFINHASVLVSSEKVGLLSDPWYQGDAFHKGWSLLHELKDDEIEDVLNRTTHIWISHEHPDHFSVLFFIKFEEMIKQRGIEILFQETKDKRVEGFLRSKGFNLRILKANKWIEIDNGFSILNFKDGFYDSGLCIDISGEKFLNLNDCEVKTHKRCREVFDLVGECDVLISQFSYAAWKGGKDNIAWRKNAAKEKLNTLSLQVKYFKPKFLIPFASYIYFSNNSNFYLNDAANSPADVINHFKDKEDINVIAMKPFQVFSEHVDPSHSNEEALQFWDQAIKDSNESKKNTFDNIDFEELNKSFSAYQERIFANNSKITIWLVRILSPISAFKPINILLDDHNKIISFDLFKDGLTVCDSDPDISMSSESLDFIMKNTFGFDTLTVNGCFEETKAGGFSRMTKTMAIENLNNIGISVRPSILLRLDIILLFIGRLFAVNKKVNNAS